MKRTCVIFLNLCLLSVCLTLYVHKAKAKTSDVETAMQLLAQARAAVGGEEALRKVQSISLKGMSTRTAPAKDGGNTRTRGEFQYILISPNRFARIDRITTENQVGNPTAVLAPEVPESMREQNVKIIVRRGSGEPLAERPERLDLAKFMIAVLLSTPADSKITFDYAGQTEVEDRTADILVVLTEGRETARLYLDNVSHLPVMLSYRGSVEPPLARPELEASAPRVDGDKRTTVVTNVITEQENREVEIAAGPDVAPGQKHAVMVFKREGAGPTDNSKQFNVRWPGPEIGAVQLRLSDYKSVDGILLPHGLSETFNGSVRSEMKVEEYLINSPETLKLFSDQNSGPFKLK